MRRAEANILGHTILDTRPLAQGSLGMIGCRTDPDQEAAMPRARVNGIEIDYEDGGRGPAVLLSHGYSATGRMWAPQRPALEPSYRLISWDMRGHGQTDSPADPAQYSEALDRGGHARPPRPSGRAARGDRRPVARGHHVARLSPPLPRDGAGARHLRFGPRLPQRRGAGRLEQARPRAGGGPRGPRARRAHLVEPRDARGHAPPSLGPGAGPRRARHARPGGLRHHRLAARAFACPR